jgi:hypothetical protein
MYLRKIYIRFKEGHPDSPNTFAAFDGFNMLGVETAPFEGFGDIETLDDLGPEVGLVGFVGDVMNALKKMGLPMPAQLDYPEELQYYIGRKIWRSTLGEMRRSTQRLFIKPVEEKLFTGFVWKSDMGDQLRVAHLPDETELWVSERVDFVSEYRCFVKDTDLIGVRHYKGDWSRVPERKMVEGAVAAFKSGPRAYALDFGVTEDGRTLLVEVNDAYALGHYGLPSVPYANMIEARWEEFTRPLLPEGKL